MKEKENERGREAEGKSKRSRRKALPSLFFFSLSFFFFFLFRCEGSYQFTNKRSTGFQKKKIKKLSFYLFGNFVFTYKIRTKFYKLFKKNYFLDLCWKFSKRKRKFPKKVRKIRKVFWKSLFFLSK